MIKKLLQAAQKQKVERENLNHYRNLIRTEAAIGGRLFGEVPEGRRREFFCLDKHTWIWHEEWTDILGRRQVRTTRYDIRPDRILKAQDGANYQAVGPEETRNLVEAAKNYRTAVFRDLYHVSA